MNSSPPSQEAMLDKLVVQRSSGPAAYSICTVFTRPAEYQGMLENLRAHGFTDCDTEFLAVDNSASNTMDAFTAYNAFLVEARAPYIVLCHQDILLMDDGREKLDHLLDEVAQQDPYWGLCGNAGLRGNGVLAVHITDPHSSNRKLGGPFPAKVTSLDENFIVVRRAANLAVSRDLKGFHMYGVDLCLIADVLGWTAYVIDFHLRHTSAGNVDASYHQGKVDLRRKYQRALRPRWIKLPTLHPVFVGGHQGLFLGARLLRKLGFWPRLSEKASVPNKLS